MDITPDFPSVKRSVEALCGVGIQVVRVCIEKGGLFEKYKRQGIQWTVVYHLKRTYPERIFENLPLPAGFNLDHKELIYASHSFARVYEVHPSLLEKLLLEDVTKPLLQWADMAEKNGHSAVWLLAGYFDEEEDCGRTDTVMRMVLNGAKQAVRLLY